MFSQTLCFGSNEDLLAFHALEEDQLVLTIALKKIKIYSSLTCKIVQEFSVEQINEQTTILVLHPLQKLAAVANGKTIYLFNFSDKTLRQTIATANAEITALCFVANTPYLFAGSANGDLIHYYYNEEKKLSPLTTLKASHAIELIDANSSLIALSSYKGESTMIDLLTYQQKNSLHTSAHGINILKLISSKFLISATIDGTFSFYDLKNSQTIKILNRSIEGVKNILPIDQQFALLVGDKLAFLDLLNYKIVPCNLLDNKHSVRFADIIHNTLFITFENNQVEKFILPTSKNLRKLLKTKEIETAYTLIANFPYLQNRAEYKELETICQQHFDGALNAYIRGKTDTANQLLEPFRAIEVKKEALKDLQESFKRYENFTYLILEKKYHIAYAIAERFAVLKKTPPFLTMEQEFEKSFLLAQREIQNNNLSNAKEILSPYSSVKSKHPFIKPLLSHQKKFLEFFDLLTTKYYRGLAILIKKEPSFAKFPLYKKLLYTLEKDLEDAKHLLREAKIDEAFKIILPILYLPELHDQADTLYKQALNTQSLLEAYKHNNFLKCYELIDNSHGLKDLELTKLLENHWRKLIYQSEQFALNGDLKGLKESLAELIVLRSRSLKTASLIRLSFHSKIKQLLNKRTYTKIEPIIYTYIDLFGVDNELQKLMELFEKGSKNKLAITTHQELYKEDERWLHSKDIVGEYKNH